MLFKLLSFASLATAAVIEPFVTQTGSVVPTGQVTINSITYGGSGCPQGTVSQFISEDKQTFTLIFDSYIVDVGPGISISKNRANCQINVDLHYPAGFQWSIYTQDYRGYASLDKGVTGLQKATYYFSGMSQQASTSTTFTGPQDGDYLLTDTIPFDSVVWSPCGSDGALNINSQIVVSNSGNKQGQGELTTDSIDGKVTFQYGIQWQTCH